MTTFHQPDGDAINMALDAAAPLCFDNLRRKNVLRTETDFRHPLFAWSETDWACALAGEAGEACNKIKKRRRADLDTPRSGDCPSVSEVAEEIADVVLYADLLAARMGIDLGAAVRSKFNKISTEIGSEIRL